MDPRQETKIFVVAGEPSGDLHAAHLFEAWRGSDPGVRMYGFGGPRLAAAGCEVMIDLASDAIMGLFPVLAALPKIKGWFRVAERTLDERRPDAVLLVDYPGFNLRLAAKAKARGIPVIYYISPQVWAWNRKRIDRIARLVDLMLVILPFEEEVYLGTPLVAAYVGHPLIDHVAAHPPESEEVSRLRGKDNRKIVALFPGSRRHVVRSLWPVLAEAARRMAREAPAPGLRFVTAAASRSLADEIRRLDPLPDLDHVIETGGTANVIAAADLCLTTSGTTTLEIALHSKPMLIAYRVSALFYILGRLLIRVPHIGLVNLVAGRTVVPEFIGVRPFGAELAKSATTLLSDPEARNEMLVGLEEVKSRLGEPGSYARSARLIAEFIADRAMSSPSRTTPRAT